MFRISLDRDSSLTSALNGHVQFGKNIYSSFSALRTLIEFCAWSRGSWFNTNQMKTNTCFETKGRQIEKQLPALMYTFLHLFTGILLSFFWCFSFPITFMLFFLVKAKRAAKSGTQNERTISTAKGGVTEKLVQGPWAVKRQGNANRSWNSLRGTFTSILSPQIKRGGRPKM